MAQNDYLTQFLTDLQNRSFRPNVMDTTVSDDVKYRAVEDVLGKSIMDYAKPINPSNIVPPLLKTQKNFQAPAAAVELLKDRGSIEGQPQSFQVPVPQSPEAAVTYATGVNKSLAEREKDYLQRKEDLGSVYGALKDSQTQYQDILNKIKEPAPDYSPSMDYQGELARLGEQEQNIQDFKEDPVAKSIMMLAPAIASIFGGETGALAAPRAAAAGNEMYSAEMKSARDENAAKRKAIAAKIESLSKMQANDVVQFSEKQKIALDRLKTTLGALEKDVSANRLYVKDEANTLNKMYEDLNKDVMHGSDKLLDSQQKESEAERKAAEAQGKLDEAIRKNATMEEINAKKLELDKQKAELEKSKADFNVKNEAEKRRLEQERINALKNKGKGGKGAGTPQEGQIVPGYIWNGKTQIAKSDIPKLQSAKADRDTITDLIKRARNQIESTDATDLINPFSSARKEIEGYLKDAQLLYKGKSFAELGVLAGPDVGYLDRILESPSAASLVSGGKSEALKRYDNAIQRIESKVQNTMAARGLKPVSAPPPSSKGGGLSREEMIKNLKSKGKYQ